MYVLRDYANMIDDRVRTDAYARALRQVLRPGGVCLDLGTGTGFFAVLACRLGARKVIAVEPNDAIHVAREVAAANGCAERIMFLQDFSTRIHLEERADVIVTELHGVLPLWERAVPTLIDARRRLLAPGGTLIPQRETLWAAVAEAPEEYRRISVLGRNSVHGIDLGVLRSRLLNTWCKTRLESDRLLVAPRPWASLDYATVEELSARGELAWTVERQGTGHGLLLWFDTTLVEGIRLCTGPGQAKFYWGQGFFPWVHPVPLAAGDLVEVALRADLVGSDYIWGWNSRVRSGGPAGPVRADFRQSTFFGASVGPDLFRKRAADYRAGLNEEGRIDAFILTHLDAAASLGDLAGKVAEQFPRRFPTWQDALTRVGDLAQKYSV
jgi:protein arginine N-methyltransferase 1